MSLLTKIGKYMLWADGKIWEIVQTLSDAEFQQSFETYGGSIYQRYLHMVGGHSGWYHKWTGGIQEDLNLEDLSRDELFEFLSRYNHKLLDLMQTGENEIKELETSRGKLPLSTEEMLFNIINHATYHRGQVVLMLRLLEKEVNPTDYLPFCIETTFE
jgi:uncharacterized damage-inducible protein DinB